MATEEQIPSPEDLKKGPVQFTNEEITSLKNFQVKTDQLVNQLGRIYLSKIKLNEQEDLLKNEIQKIEKEEQELAKSLSDKYGRGSLDINTGTFTPVE